MKLNATQYNIFKMHVNYGLTKENKNLDFVKEFIKQNPNEKFSNYSCLIAVRLAMKTDEGWDFVQSLNLKDSHWVTVGRKYFKELAA